MNETNSIAPVLFPEVKAYRPDERRYISAGGRFLRVNNRVLIYGEYMTAEMASYIIGHEMLHFILLTLIDGGACHTLDNIAEFGSEL